jgi:hypothetical protein
MPLLRYDIGDVVRISATRDCACGLRSDGPLLERVEGRASDCTEAGGETITPLMLDDAIHAALGPDATIEQWQLDGDVLLVVDGTPPRAWAAAGAASTEAAAAEAAGAVGALLARPVRGERVSAIAPDASGKYRLVKH